MEDRDSAMSWGRRSTAEARLFSPPEQNAEIVMTIHRSELIRSKTVTTPGPGCGSQAVSAGRAGPEVPLRPVRRQEATGPGPEPPDLHLLLLLEVPPYYYLTSLPANFFLLDWESASRTRNASGESCHAPAAIDSWLGTIRIVLLGVHSLWCTVAGKKYPTYELRITTIQQYCIRHTLARAPIPPGVRRIWLPMDASRFQPGLRGHLLQQVWAWPQGT